MIADGEVGFSTSGSGTIRYNLGALRRDDFDGVKHEGNLSLGSVAERGVTARAFDSETSSVDERRTRRHLTAEASYAFWRIVPTLTYGTERYRQYVDAAADTGQAYELVRIRLARRNPQGLSLHIDAEERVTDEVDPNTDEWRESRTDQTLSAAMSVRRYRSVQGEMQYTHRIEDDATLGRTTTDLGRLKSTIRSESTGIRSDIDYEISQEAGRTLERSVIFVGEGNGDFNAQGELVGKDKGAFTIVFSPTENIVPTIGVAVNLRFAWKPAEGGRGIGAAGLWGWIRKNVSLDWTFGVREQTTYDPAWKVFLLVPSALQRDGATLFGTSTIRQDWSLLEGVKNVALTLRYQRQDTEDNRFEGIRENRVFEELQLRLSRSLSEKYTATAELGRSVNRRDGPGIPAATGSSYDIVGGWVLGGLGVRFSPGSTVDVDVKVESQEDHESSAQQIVLSVRPRLVWRVSGKVNVFASYEYNQTLDRGDALIKPIPFLHAGDSHRWSVAPNIRLARVISIVATYQGRSETTFTGSRVTEHELRLETRALF